MIAGALAVLVVLMSAGVFVSYQYGDVLPFLRQQTPAPPPSGSGTPSAGGTSSAGKPPAPSQTGEPSGTEPDPSSSVIQTEPVTEPGLGWNTTPVLREEQMPGDYNGLELPIQGATGYTSIALPLWQNLKDMETARLAVEAWERGEPIDGSADQTTASSAASSLSAQTGGLLSLLSSGSSAADRNTSDAGAGAQTDSGDPAGQQSGEAGEENNSAPSAEGSQDSDTSAGGQESQTGEKPNPISRPPLDPNRVPTLTDGALAILPPGTPFTIVQEEESWWLVQCEAEYEVNGERLTGEFLGWVEHRYCMVNLPDVIPSIIYDAANGYSSLFVSCGKALKGITGEALYTGKTENPRLGQEEFMMPVLYSMAFRLCAAQRAALAEGNCLVLYEGYRPLETQLQVSDALRVLMRQDSQVREAVSSAPWSISWFIATSASNHQHGYAVDVSLARVSTMQVHFTGNYRYLRALDYEIYTMPTAMHELSRAAATFIEPVASNSMTAWKLGILSPTMNETALGLQGYCTGAGLTPLSSEWWHFNDLAARSSVLDNLGEGNFEITVCRSMIPPAEPQNG